jgi:tetratricopeptide (TPR) repeat protein
MRIPFDFRDEKDDSRTAGILANIHYLEYDLAQSLYWYKRKIELAAGDKLLISHALGGMSFVYKELGMYEEAITCILEKLELARSLGEHRGITGASGLLGVTLQEFGDYERAKLCHAFNIHESLLIGDHRVAALSMGIMSAIFTEQGELVTAKNLITRSVSCLHRLQAPAFLCDVLLYMASMHEAEGSLDEAWEVTQEGLRLAEQLQRKYLTFMYNVLAVRLEYLRDRLSNEEASRRLRDLAGILPRHHEEARAATVYECWRIGTATEQERDSAISYYEEACRKFPKHEYRVKYEQMTGRRMAPPVLLDSLPREMNHFQFDIMDIIARFDTYHKE